MNTHTEHHLAAVERTVSSLKRDGKPAKAVTLARSYPTSIDNIWDALSNIERIPLWFSPISGDLKPGGRYQLEGNAGGDILVCEYPARFSLTWEMHDDVSWVDVKLEEVGETAVRLTLTHTAEVSEFWTDFGPGAAGVGWELGLLALAHHLAVPAAPKFDENEFSSSHEGKIFVATSSAGWGNASIAAGTDADTAMEAAARTSAFYTGES